jgi:crotonobetainyl-CoA:carnitine CoA-transferase CaiB-like acyl-CoA transferase
MLLADLGAEIIKVEGLAGDLAREIGPFYDKESAFFMAVNRGKRSIAVDAKTDVVKDVLRDLCRRSDVVLNNLRLGAMERMGLGFEDLRDEARHLVYAVITAFGATGPFAERPGIDLIFQGESGMMSIAGAPGDPPQKTATTIADFVAGTNMAMAICAALTGGGGRRGGVGRLVEVSLRDGLIAVQAGWNAQYFALESQPPRTGTASPVTGPNETFRTSDGFVNIAVVSDRHFREFCLAIGMAEIAADRRFASNSLRVENRHELSAVVQEVLASYPTAHWVETLSRVGVPVGRILDLGEVFSDPQVIHNEMLLELDHPRAGRIRTQGSPIRMDGQSARAAAPAPYLGEHSRAVLAELGIGSSEIDQLVSSGLVIG